MSDYENLLNIKEESSSGGGGGVGGSNNKNNSGSGNFDGFERLDDYPIHEQPEAEEKETDDIRITTEEYENLLNIIEESGDSGGGGNNKNNKSGNFDDFERLDDYPIHEQPEAEERETVPADFGAHHDGIHDFLQKSPSAADVPPTAAAASGLHSTDRPLVTSGGSESGGSPVPPTTAVGSPETTEVHLTPDPEEWNKVASEPFINITANVGEIPVDYGSRSAGQGHVTEPTPSPPEPAVHHAEPSAPPEPSLFDPYPYHGTDEKAAAFGGGGSASDSLKELLNLDKPAASDFTLVENESRIDEHFSHHHHHQKQHEVLTSQLITSGRNVAEEIIKEESFNAELSETQSSSTDDHKVEDVAFRETVEAVEEVNEPKVTSQPESADSQGDVRKCMFHPLAELMYWRDVKKSAIVLGAGLAVLLPLTCYSFISVVSYLLLAVVISTLLFTFFKSCMQFVQKTGDGHPFKPYLDCDLALPEEKVRDVAVIVVKHLEHTAQALRHLLLAENFVDSVKFAVVLWCFTYIGSWFNGLTLIILAFVAFFTLPKFYETYKVQIDHYLDIACTQVNDVMNKVKAKIPIGKKPKQQ